MEIIKSDAVIEYHFYYTLSKVYVIHIVDDLK